MQSEMEQKSENLWYYDGTMINDISFQVSREVHFSHFVEYVNIMRGHTHTHTHIHIYTSLRDPDIHGCVHRHTRIPQLCKMSLYPGVRWMYIHILGRLFLVWLTRERCNMWLHAVLDVTLFICTFE